MCNTRYWLAPWEFLNNCNCAIQYEVFTTIGPVEWIGLMTISAACIKLSSWTAACSHIFFMDFVWENRISKTGASSWTDRLKATAQCVPVTDLNCFRTLSTEHSNGWFCGRVALFEMQHTVCIACTCHIYILCIFVGTEASMEYSNSTGISQSWEKLWALE